MSSGQHWSRCYRRSPWRPPAWPRRGLIDGIRFRVRIGVPWREIPVEHEPWNRVYVLFRRWRRNRT
ncbi:transposase [Streptomyces sp. NPDC001822]|uniref:transposase n=1 Tax=Streptomyces sp. NPDC001822 TaxID=3364614 RepID=UPI00367D615C